MRDSAKPEHLETTHTNHGRVYKMHTKKVPLPIRDWTQDFLQWGDSTNHCATVPLPSQLVQSLKLYKFLDMEFPTNTYKQTIIN